MEDNKRKSHQEKPSNIFNLPHNESLEETIIGCLLLESTAIMSVCKILSPDMFYNSVYKTIYAVIEDMHYRYERPDLVTVLQELTKKGLLDEIGGPYRLATLSQNVASTSNVDKYAMVIKQLWLSRKIAIFGMTITQKACDPTSDVDDVLSEMDREVKSISDSAVEKDAIMTVGQAAQGSVAEYYNCRQGDRKSITTGIEKLDSVLGGGFKDNQMIVLAARAAMGKTSVMLHFAESAARADKHVLAFSLEMSSEELAGRLIVSVADIDSQGYRQGLLKLDEEQRLGPAMNKLSETKIDISDTANVTINKIRSIAMEQQRKGRLDMIMIDYLQLIDMRQGNKSYGREQEVSQTSRACKMLAKELKVPVIVLSQLSRAVEQRVDKRPMLSDLRESGAIEQDADVVIFIYRDEYYNDNAEKGMGELVIAKQRGGGTGIVPFSYNESLTRIGDYKGPMPMYASVEQNRPLSNQSKTPF